MEELMMVDQEANKKQVFNNKKADYEFYTGKTSEINRTFALAGIAIIWIFKTTDSKGQYNIPIELLAPLKWFIFALLLDLFHYFVGGLIWWRYFKYYEKKKVSANKKANPIYPNILHTFYFSKVACCIYAYYNLLLYFKCVLNIEIFKF
jgi:hypothetical protein